MSETNFDINSILDGTLDDLDDMPEFKPFPAGLHKCTMKVELKKINTISAFDVRFSAIETVELADAGDTPLIKGVEANIAFLMDNEYGQGGFKKILQAATEKFGAKSNRELIADMQNAEVQIITSLRKDKKDASKVYMQLVDIAFD